MYTFCFRESKSWRRNIEFTVENNKLWMLQTRTGKRAAKDRKRGGRNLPLLRNPLQKKITPPYGNQKHGL